MRSVVTVAKDGATRKTLILSTYVGDKSPEFAMLRDAIERYLKADDSVDCVEVHFPERV